MSVFKQLVASRYTQDGPVPGKLIMLLMECEKVNQEITFSTGVRNLNFSKFFRLNVGTNGFYSTKYFRLVAHTG